MRVVLVNWARLWDGASYGGGVNGHVQALALELVRRGHDVVSLCSGNTYDTGDAIDAPGQCRAVRHPDWRGVRVFEIINSPVLAPSLAQFDEPMAEVSSPDLEAEVATLLERLAPGVVHFHSLEGLSIGVLDAARNLPSRPQVIFSLHNYHTICPQVCLMQGHRRPCRSFDGGHRCIGCVPSTNPGGERAFRAVTRLQTGSGVAGRDGSFPVLTDDDARRPVVMRGPDLRGQIGEIRLDNRPHLWSGIGLPDPVWEPFENVVEPEPPTDRPPNNYARRREAMVSMLNRCDSVLAVSTFVEAKFRTMGVNPRVLSMVHIGCPMTELAASLAPAAREGLPDADVDDVVRIGFMGYNNWYKGLPLLAAALELLPSDVLSRIHLSVFAVGGDEPEARFTRVRSQLDGALFVRGYEYDAIPRLLDRIDLGVVPSTWWDNGPQTVMEYLACGVPVLGAEAGGIPDLVQHDWNGWLFRANDPEDLARRLDRIVSDPRSLRAVRRNVLPPKGVVEHAVELEELYARAAAPA
ncbi:MAG TPA: glycosyltransferase [Acidimicrobiales bacterium]|nr:glycosyltransferase [Acidimicrobiales bacterium]